MPEALTTAEGMTACLEILGKLEDQYKGMYDDVVPRLKKNEEQVQRLAATKGAGGWTPPTVREVLLASKEWQNRPAQLQRGQFFTVAIARKDITGAGRSMP